MVVEYDELRRMVLAVAAGAALFTMVSQCLGGGGTPDRIAASTWTTTAIGCRACGAPARHKPLVQELYAAPGVGSVRH